MIIETDEEYGDFLINFMQPHGPLNSFNWPTHQDKCWVPKKYVLCVVVSPNRVTRRGQYQFSKQTVHIISCKWRLYYA